MGDISLSSTICGLAVGTLVLCANFQFGLQTGWVSMMSMPAALLGYAWFKTIRFALTPQQNVYIQSVAVAVGTGPLSFGLVGAIPAVQLLLSDEEGKIDLSWFQLTLWSLGIAYIGIFTAVLLRQMILSDKQLKFPSGSAAAALIGVLHDKPVVTDLSNEESIITERLSDYYTDEIHSNNHNQRRQSRSSRPDTSLMLNSDDGKNKTYKKNIIALAVMFVLSSVYTLLNKLFGFFQDIPIFGSAAAVYMWKVQFSPAYIGQGIIMGLPTTASMMLGAILGWAVLVPLSDKMNWAPGPIDDWQTGAQGWIMWVSLAIMVADTTVSFGILMVTPVINYLRSHSRSHKYQDIQQFDSESRNFELSIEEESSDEGEDEDDTASNALTPAQIERPAYQHRVAILGLAASSIVCILCVKFLFHRIPILALTIAVIVSPFLSLLGIRALGETDLNPVSSIAKLTQFVFGLLMRNKPDAVLLNIIAGAITEAGAQQAGDLMQDYKTGSLVGALMTHQTIGMAVGTTWSVIISGLIYKLYTSHFEIPGTEFRIPTAYIWADCARLMTGQGLPPKVGIFSLSLGGIFAVLAVVKHVYHRAYWVKWIPSGVAVGIGMYNIPSFTIARFIGGVTAFIYQKCYTNPADEVYLVILSSGLILGEGLMSVVYLLAVL